MGSNWSALPLENIATVIDSKHQTPQYSESGYPMVRVVDVKGGELSLIGAKKVTADVYADYSKGRDPEVGDLIISRVGRHRKISYVSSKDKFCLGQNVAFIIPRDNDRFLYYALISPPLMREIDSMAVGAAQKTISLKNIKGLKIPQPPLNERAKISHFLSSLDDKVALNHQINMTLEQMALALFKSWFVDFDPVVDNALDTNFFEQGLEYPSELLRRAETRRAVRARQDFKPLPDATRQLFPSAFEKCTEPCLGLGGWVPQGWAISNFGAEFDVIIGQSPPSTTYNKNKNGMPFFQGKMDFGFRFPSERIYCTKPKRIAKKNDTLVSMRAPVGHINLANENCAIGRGLAAARHKSGSISFSYYTISSLSEKLKLFEAAGTVFGCITQKDLHSLHLIKPDGNVVNRFELLCSSWDKHIEHISIETLALTNLRDTLLPKLISGELRFGYI
ncbi:restriction endonuclease subunit S [Aeromonas sp. 603607]|uniref:restriction endonuclease subunit S n=1 Tax=Aeromonas sp. 603607 TaxID=2712048 RepID=UPI003BA2A4C3